ncbi:MAG: YncE family protein [Planctomycetes bacterium]|nr:YncE family protein [Planctomycetota bacterium]
MTSIPSLIRRSLHLACLSWLLASLTLYAADYQVIATVPVGASPSGMAVDSASRFAYISCSGSNQVAVLDLATLTMAAAIPVGSGPSTPLLSPDEVTLLVPNLFSRSISVIDVPTRKVARTLQVGRYPSTLAFDSSGSTAYAYLTVAGGDHELDIIDARLPAIVARIPLPPTSFLNDLWISPDGSTAYLADSGSGRVLVVDLVERRVSTSVIVASLPLDVTPTNDSNLLVVSCYGADSISLLRRDTLQVRAQVPVGRRPFRSATHFRSGVSYVLCSGSQAVWALDPVTLLIEATLAAPGLTGPSPRGDLAFDPDGTRLLVSAYQMSQVHAYGTDPAERGGAYHALAQDVTVASGPTQMTATSDGRRILVLCPSAGSVAVLEGTTPLQVIENTAAEIEAALSGPATNFGSATRNIELALARLVGKSAESGAISKLEAGDLSGALASIQSAIQFLEKAQSQGADTRGWRQALATASGRETRTFLDVAVSQVGSGNPWIFQAETQFGTGIDDLNAGRYRQAVLDFKTAADSAQQALP